MPVIFITLTVLDNPYFKPKTIRNSLAFICSVKCWFWYYFLLTTFSYASFSLSNWFLITIYESAENAGFKNHHFQSFYVPYVYFGFGNSSRAHLHHHQSPQPVVGMLTWISCSVGYWPVELGFNLILKKIISFILFLTMIVLIVILLVGLIYSKLIIFWPRNLIL